MAINWTISDFGDAVQTFLDGLTLTERAKGVALIVRLREAGHTLREPVSKSLDGGLFELRSTSGIRIFYTFGSTPGRIILLGGFVKKRQDIPVAVLRTMRDRQGKANPTKKGKA